MALIAKSGTPSLASVLPPQNMQIRGDAAEAIAAGDLCYISGLSAEGKPLISRSNGTAAGAAAVCHGISTMAAPVGAAVTLLHNVAFHYGAGLTAGQKLYVGATAGQIDNAATIGGTAPIGFVIDATRVYIRQSTY